MEKALRNYFELREKPINLARLPAAVRERTRETAEIEPTYKLLSLECVDLQDQMLFQGEIRARKKIVT